MSRRTSHQARLTASSAPARFTHGQALVLGLFFVFAVAAVLLLMFNSGRAVDEKLRITNAADAAAWSVATLQARALNYDAHTNRAIVANQIAIAQAVSLVSWMHYFESGVRNSGALARVASSWLYNPAEYPRLLQVLATVTGSAYADAGMGGGSLAVIVDNLDRALATIVRVHDAVSSALSASQTVMHASLAGGLAQTALANDIVRRIDPAMRAELNLASYDFDRFTSSYARPRRGNDERGRLADIVSRSRDGFTRERVWSIDGPDIPFLQRNVKLKRRGGTELIGYDEWRAMDTLEHQGQRLRKGRWRWQRTPIAGAAASVTAEDERSPQRGHHGGSYRDNATTTKRYAEPSMVQLDEVGAHFSGLPTTRELSELDEGALHTTGITLRVGKSRGSLRTSGGSSIVQPGGRLQQFDVTIPGGQMVALSRAEVFFERPLPRTDARVERPSLYSPYWQVRLTNPTAADRAWAALGQDGLALP